MHVLFYEIGHENSNILGSGTDYIVDYHTKYEKDAFYYFSQPGTTFMRRLVRDGLKLKQEYYDMFRDLWE